MKDWTPPFLRFLVGEKHNTTTTTMPQLPLNNVPEKRGCPPVIVAGKKMNKSLV
jgi:hypothetical protein